MKTIDIHTHGIGGYDTHTKDPEEILAMASIHGSSDVSAIVPTIYSGTLEEMRSQLATIKRAMEAQAEHRSSDAGAAVILGAHLEGPFLNPIRAGALDPATFIEPGEYPLRSLVEGFEDVIKIITVAPELSGGPELITRCAKAGISVSMGHTDATFHEAEAGFHHGAKGITHFMNAARPFHQREPGIIGFGLLNPHIFVELIADPFHLHPRSIELVFRLKDPSKIMIVSDTVKETPVMVRDRRKEAIIDGNGALKGGSMTVTEAAQRLMSLDFDKDAVTRAAGTNQAVYLG
ncbi:MAG TPA: hypothetical protein VGJ94_15805 [Syntrophorhabdaceae bacterium]|jgi:N-acetylglucosamine-6-phosphate deacetylase